MPPATPLPQGTLDLLILKILSTGQSHGYAIARRIEDITDDALRVEEGSLYPALHRMQQRGWIGASWSKSELGKDVKVYDLTPRGRAHLRRRSGEWAAMTKAVAKVLKLS